MGGRRIRVLYLQSNSEIGGSDIALLRILENLDLGRFDPVVVVPSNGPLIAAFSEHGARVILMPRMLKVTTRKGRLYHLRFIVNYPWAVAKLVRIMRREQIDLVHTNTLHNLYGFMAAWVARLPHVWHVREIVSQSATIRRVEAYLAPRFSDRLVAVSHAAAEMFRNGKNDVPPHLRVVPDGVDLESFHPQASGVRIRAELGIDPDAPVVGLVGRLDAGKGVDVFLEAAAICHDEFPEARFVVCGGEVRGQEEVARAAVRHAAELGLGDRVSFTHWRYRPEDMPEVYAALDVLVSASTTPESFGLVLIEAMASARPVIATDHGGPREVCAEGETGLLVPPRDPPRMAGAILDLLRDRARAAAMGAEGRRRAEQRFDQQDRVRQLEALYDEVLTARPGTRVCAEINRGGLRS